MSGSSSKRLRRQWLTAIGALPGAKSSSYASTSRHPLVTRDLVDSTLAQIDVSSSEDATWVCLACIDAIEKQLEPLARDNSLTGRLIEVGANAANALYSATHGEQAERAVEVMNHYRSLFDVWNKVYGEEADRFTSQWTDAPTPLHDDGEAEEEEMGGWAELAETTPSPIAPQSLRTSALEFTLSSLGTQAMQVALSGHCKQLLSFIRAVPAHLLYDVREMYLNITQALLTAIAAGGETIGEVASLDLLPRLYGDDEASVWSQLTAQEGQTSPTNEGLLSFYRSVIETIEEQFARPDFALELSHWVSSPSSGIVIDEQFARLREDLDLLVRLVYRHSSPASNMTLAHFRRLLVSASDPRARNHLATQYLDGITDTGALKIAFNHDIKQLLWVIAQRDNEANSATTETNEDLWLKYEHDFLVYLADNRTPSLLRLLMSDSGGNTSLDVEQGLRVRLVLAVLLARGQLDIQSADVLTNSVVSCLSHESATKNSSPANPLRSLLLPSHLTGKAQSCADIFALLDRSNSGDVYLYLRQARTLQQTSVRLGHFVDEASIVALAALEGQREEQIAFVMRTVRSFSRSAGHVQQYAQLADTLRASVGPSHAFDCLTDADVAKIVVEGAARAGDAQMFDQVLSAESDGLLDAQQQEDIVMDAAEELYDNATSANLHQGDMKMAYELLSRSTAYQRSARVQLFKNFIEATSKLCAFRVPSEIYAGGGTSLLTPIEIRLSTDRLTLIRRLLDSREDTYKTADMVLDIAQKLCAVPPGARQDRRTAEAPSRVQVENRTLAMLTDAALAHGDYERAQSTCERLIANTVALGKRVEQTAAASQQTEQEATRTVRLYDELRALAHRTCHQLSKQPDWHDLTAKLRWAGFALAFCAPEQLSQYLKAWRQIAEEVDEELRRNPPKALLYDGAQPRRSNVIARLGAGGGGGGGAPSLGGLGAALQAHTGGLSAAGLAALSQFGGSVESYAANPLGALLGRAPAAVRPLASQRGAGGAQQAASSNATLTRSASGRSNASSATGGGPASHTTGSPISRAARLFDGLGGGGGGGPTESSTPSEGQPGYMDPAERAARAARRFFHGLGAGF